MRTVQMRTLYSVFILCLLACGQRVMADDHGYDRASFVALVAARLPEIDNLMESSLYEESPGTILPLSQALADLNSKGDTKIVRDILLRLVDYSLYLDGKMPNPEHVRHDVVVAVLAHALHDPDSTVRNLALWHLSDHAAPAQLSPNKNALVSAWDHDKSHRLLFVIGRLKPKEIEDFYDSLVESGFEIPEVFRARMGEPGSAKKLIGQFQNETDGQVKGERALDLGYVGTSEAVKALCEKIRTPETVGDWQSSYSVRYKIIRGLGRAFPEEALFNDELAELVYRTSNPVFHPENLSPEQVTGIGNAYLDRVEQWCREHYSVDWDEPRPPFHLVKEEIKIHPLPQ